MIARSAIISLLATGRIAQLECKVSPDKDINDSCVSFVKHQTTTMSKLSTATTSSSNLRRSHHQPSHLHRPSQWRFIVHDISIILVAALCLLSRSTATTTRVVATNHDWLLVVTAFHPTTTKINRNLQHHTIGSSNRILLPSIVSSKSPTNSKMMLHHSPHLVLCSKSINGGEDSRSEDVNRNDQSMTNEIVARRIIVKGDVQGGYYRSCVLNEVCSSYIYIYIHKQLKSFLTEAVLNVYTNTNTRRVNFVI